MRILNVVALLGSLASSAVAFGQTSDAQFRDDVMRRIDRLERTVDRLERRLDDSGAGRPDVRDDEVVAASSEVCGTLMANCQREALRYCERLHYARGVPIRIEPRGQFNYMTRVRCFN